MRKIVILLLICVLASAEAFAQSQTQQDLYNPVQTAVTSRSIAPEAVGSSMGDIGAATTPDVYSQYWNPAKYPFTVSRAGLAISYTPWLKSIVDGIALLQATGYGRIGDYQAISASLNYFTVGEVTVEKSDMVVRPYELSVDVAYSRMLSEWFSAAVALRYMYSDMSGHAFDDMRPGNAFAADLAIYWNRYFMMGQRECQFALGLNISDIGTKINFGDDHSYFIPTRIRLGLNLSIPLNEYNRLSFNAEANRLLVPSKPLQGEDESDVDYNDRLTRDYYSMSSITGIFKSFGDSPRGFKGEMAKILFGVGAEYTYNDRFFVRAGYHHESDWEGGRKYATFGAGFHMSAFAVDASYVWATSSSNPLDKTLRVSLGFDFDGLKDLFGRKRR